MNTISKQWGKLNFVLQHLPYYVAPNFLRTYCPQKDLDSLTDAQQLDVIERVDLLNKLHEPFSLSESASCLKELILKKKTAYKLDFAKATLGCSRETKFDCVFGDVTKIPLSPSIVKTRPIIEGNENSVILKLNTPRHYSFYEDPYQYRDKADTAVFRGLAHTEERRRMIESFEEKGFTDFKPSYKKGGTQKNYMTPQDQMKSKFIVSLEGVDVASNLKWVMATNSLCMMPKPKMESWFLESRLIPGVHYIEVKGDFSNMEEVMQPYLDDHEKATEMIKAKKAYLEPFLNPVLDRVISHQVIARYLSLCQ